MAISNFSALFFSHQECVRGVRDANESQRSFVWETQLSFVRLLLLQSLLMCLL